MAYIGQDPVIGRYIIVDQISGGFNGTASGFTLAAGGQGVIPGLAQNVLLSLGGVIQQPGTDYTVSGSGITFTTPPLSGTTFFATVLGDVQAVGTPSDGTVLPASIATSGTFVFPNLTTTGTTLIASGNASTPSLAVIGDTNTGLYSPGADQLAISTNGTGRLFVDSNGRLGIGIASPASLLCVGGNTPTTGKLSVVGDASGVSLAVGDNISSSLYIKHQSAGCATFGTDGGGSIGFATDGFNERARIDSSGRLLVGTSTARTIATQSSAIQNEGTSFGTTGFSTCRNSNDVYGSYIHFGKTRGASVGSNTIVASGDELGGLIFGGADGTDVDSQAAYILCQVDGTPGVNDMPGRLVFWTTPDGAAGPTERLRIDSSGRVGIGTTGPSTLLHCSSGSVDIATFQRSSASADAAIMVIDSANTGAYLSTGGGANIILATRSTGTNTERARIDSSGRLLVGTSSAYAAVSGVTPFFQLQGTGENAYASIARWAASTANGGLIFNKSRGASVGTRGVVAASDGLGEIAFAGDDGTNFIAGARIEGIVDGTPGTNDMPGRLVFSTTADGASSSTERMRINNTGSVTMQAATSVASGTHSFQDNGSSPNTVRLYNNTDSNNTGNRFLICDAGASILRAEIRSNGGLANYSANNVNLSDRNVKKDIVPAAGTWNCLKEWEIVNFRYKDQPEDADLNMGVIAQQVAESCPEVITVFQEAKEATETEPAQEERLGVKDQQMMWMAIKALQEAQLRIETLEAEVAALKGA
jgi:hypothetical protein